VPQQFQVLRSVKPIKPTATLPMLDVKVSAVPLQ